MRYPRRMGAAVSAARREAGFERPRFDEPLEIDRRVEGCPADGAVKGMFFTAIAEEAERRSGRRVGRETYVAFRGYPLAEWLELLPAAATAAYPHLPPREGMRRFGREAFAVFQSSLAGRVLMSLAGRNVSMALGLAGRAFDVIGSHGSVSVLVNEPGLGVLAIRDMWDYIVGWHVGIWEGGFAQFGQDVEVRVRQYDLANADLELRYWPRAAEG